MKLLLFGVIQDIIGESQIDFELVNCKTVHDLQERFLIKYPQIKDLKKFAFAVNESYANLETEIKESDTVAIIPPVSGG